MKMFAHKAAIEWGVRRKAPRGRGGKRRGERERERERERGHCK